MWCAVILACDRSPAPPPPPSTQPISGEQINGTERLGWEQRASDTAELATFRYVVYVDGVRTELAGTSCATATVNNTYSCSARLPPMSSGNHTLELASFIVDGSILESARSAPLGVIVRAATPPTGQQQPGAPFRAGRVLVDGDQTQLLLELVANDVIAATDLAFAPDGRLFIGDQSGRVRILLFDDPMAAGNNPPEVRLKADTTVAAGFSRPDVRLKGDITEVIDDAEAVLALAFDPRFDRTRFVYVLYTTRSRAGASTFAIARFRETSNTLADRVVILDDVRASTSNPVASLRFGPDGKLYAAFDDGGDAGLSRDLASPNGKVLRLNSDGSTPDDQAGSSPLYASPYRSPRGFDWDPSGGRLWIVEAIAPDSGRLSAVVAPDRSRKRGVTTATFSLPESMAPSSMAFYRGGAIPAFDGSLLIAANKAQHLLRIRFDPDNRTRIVGTEKLLQNRVGAIRAVTIGPDGAVYFATDGAIGRLTPLAVGSRQ